MKNKIIYTIITIMMVSDYSLANQFTFNNYSMQQQNYDQQLLNTINIISQEHTNCTLQIATINNKWIAYNTYLLAKMNYLPYQIVYYNQFNNEALLYWNSKHIPVQLLNLAIINSHNIMYKSAIYHFEKEYKIPHKLYSPQTMYTYLYQAYINHFTAKKPFVWIYVNQKIPEKLTLYEDGKIVFKSPVNTGVRDTTVSGNFLIYARFKHIGMHGYFPGTHIYYNDPYVPWVNFFYKGEAIHGFPRRHYGYPQSAGCIELPVNKAKKLYPMLYKYALVTVSSLKNKRSKHDK